jgi:leucyl-tRNA synthetase
VLCGCVCDCGAADSSQWLLKVWSAVQTHLTRRAATPAPAAPSASAAAELTAKLTEAIARVTVEMDALAFGRAIKQLQTLTTQLTAPALTKPMAGTQPYEQAIRSLLTMMAPLAPHMTAELWARLNQTNAAAAAPADIHSERWPSAPSLPPKSSKAANAQ